MYEVFCKQKIFVGNKLGNRTCTSQSTSAVALGKMRFFCFILNKALSLCVNFFSRIYEQ